MDFKPNFPPNAVLIAVFRSAQKCASKEVCCLLPEDTEFNEPTDEPPPYDLQPADDPSVIGNGGDNVMEEVDEGDFATVPENVDEKVEENSEPSATGETGVTGSGSSSFFVCGVPNKANVDFKVSGDADGELGMQEIKRDQLIIGF